MVTFVTRVTKCDNARYYSARVDVRLLFSTLVTYVTRCDNVTQ